MMVGSLLWLKQSDVDDDEMADEMAPSLLLMEELYRSIANSLQTKAQRLKTSISERRIQNFIN